MTPLPLGSTIGILGGGQLGRMLANAGARLGFDIRSFDPDPDAPAGRVSAGHVAAAFDDLDAVRAFARDCAAVTFEFENIPVAAADAAAAEAPLRPGSAALLAAQDRVEEKTFLNGRGVKTAAFAPVASLAELTAALGAIGAPAILKTRRLGYDGKGQARISQASDAAAEVAWRSVAGAPCILEGQVDFVRELSVIAARGQDGAIACYPLTENRHEAGVLRESQAPAAAATDITAQAERIARVVLEALDYVGVLAVELFETRNGALLVNELAPRVHNSGHWTLDAAACDQFEQHIRAIAGWPLGSPRALRRARMVNLLGDSIDDALAHSARPDAHVHVYGKRAARPGRKMGHVTFVEDSAV